MCIHPSHPSRQREMWCAVGLFALVIPTFTAADEFRYGFHTPTAVDIIIPGSTLNISWVSYDDLVDIWLVPLSLGGSSEESANSKQVEIARKCFTQAELRSAP
jgi:hypothetical protein